MMNRKKTPAYRLYLRLALSIVFVLIITIIFFSITNSLLTHNTIPNIRIGRLAIILTSAVASLTFGGIAAFFALRIPMSPINQLLQGMTRLAEGHFEERISFGRSGPLQGMEKTFNTLASELQNTEMLRSDFVNNFSHEFKTPIVSIRGFARLLQREDLTEEQRREYVQVIVDESTRLANMATNVLNMTKVENQSILTEVKTFNLSEQLRHCILLLEKKWSRKGLTVHADFPEYNIAADHSMLEQVWVNLLENAIKFAYEGSEIGVYIAQMEDTMRISIHNHGPEIDAEAQKRIFDKFWQGDTSHASEGTGIGLSLVKRIVELHKGEIAVSSDSQRTVFTVVLPR